MPLFTKFKKAKEAAVEHKKTAAAEQEKPPAPPYRHVPTHAKQDALATQPTTVRPEELQARIAAARKRRGVSWQSSVATRQSIYHSCESSRASSRTNSTAQFGSYSATSSLKGKGSSAESIGAVLRRPQSFSHGQSLQPSNGQLQYSELMSPVMSETPSFPNATGQRLRPIHTKSRRSSFAKKKSPLSKVSVEEEPDAMSSGSSNTSSKSTQSSATDNSYATNDSRMCKVRERAATIVPSQPTPNNPVVNHSQIPLDSTPISRKSKWSIFQRKGVDITAH